MVKQNNSRPYIILSTIVTIVTLLCLIVGIFSVVQGCCKIVKTGANLIVLNDNAQFYNEQYRKTDAMTEEYNANVAERQAIYNSEDVVIRVFSNLPSLLKVLVWLVALIAIPFVPVITLVYLLRRIYVIIRIMERHRSRQRGEARTHTKSI